MKDSYKKQKKEHGVQKHLSVLFFRVISFKGFCQAGKLVYWAACPLKGPETTLSFILHRSHSALDVAGRQKRSLSRWWDNLLGPRELSLSPCPALCPKMLQQAAKGMYTVRHAVVIWVTKRCFFFHQGFDFVHPPHFPKNKLERACKLCLDVLKAYYFLQPPVCILFSFKVNVKSKLALFIVFRVFLGMNNQCTLSKHLHLFISNHVTDLFLQPHYFISHQVSFFILKHGSMM